MTTQRWPTLDALCSALCVPAGGLSILLLFFSSFFQSVFSLRISLVFRSDQKLYLALYDVCLVHCLSILIFHRSQPVQFPRLRLNPFASLRQSSLFLRRDMLAWTTRGKHCLSCTYQALSRPATRKFTTTAPLYRGSKKSKAKKEQEDVSMIAVPPAAYQNNN